MTLSDGKNVTKGDKLIYDLKTGQATVETSGERDASTGNSSRNQADATKRASKREIRRRRPKAK